MSMRSLLIRSKNTGRLYLIDNGSGDKFNEKMSRIYGLDYTAYNLLDSLEAAGVRSEDITDLIFTHLHFDHCGGTTSYNENESLVHNFPNAAYHVHERHWKTATTPNSREKASFLSDNINPIKESGRLHLTNDETVFEDGLSLLMAEGHTEAQQLPFIQDHERQRAILFAADLIPTHVHVPLPWVMGYDMRPLVTLQEKEKYLRQFASEGTYLFLEHDAFEEMIQVGYDNDAFYVSKTLKLQDLQDDEDLQDKDHRENQETA